MTRFIDLYYDLVFMKSWSADRKPVWSQDEQLLFGLNRSRPSTACFDQPKPRRTAWSQHTHNSNMSLPRAFFRHNATRATVSLKPQVKLAAHIITVSI